MIIRILNFINNGGEFSSKAISKELGISEIMAEQLREQLIKQEYIKREEGCKPEMCSKCNCGCSNKALNDIIKWELTEKSKNALKKNNL
ncbi:hypothetical protein [Clostridium fallax]|uniref:FeoC like transcriptional regulator n=1 Tax=Clostridium fallax TaxID=1533 RepID=A0A1M4SN49_9CLOT|nr:hypothetical protein [Clostridium fallax]SHE33599.1 hypothetical protein SAMN05443638_101101 [Clostridium fallax]SQB07901.1 transcriptional regulator [Clostridium fallax]